MNKVKIAEGEARPRDDDLLRRCAERLPRPIRFLGVGGIGLIADLAVFTVVVGAGFHPLVARLASLAIATVVTWRLNRALTFDPSGRHQSAEAMRYALVTATAQGTNYAVFAMLVVTTFASLPQAALLAGAVAGAVLSYTGHQTFSFAPGEPVLVRGVSDRERKAARR